MVIFFLSSFHIKVLKRVSFLFFFQARGVHRPKDKVTKERCLSTRKKNPVLFASSWSCALADSL